jgi:hypothetical protein
MTARRTRPSRAPPGLAARTLMEAEQVLCATPDRLVRAGAPAHPCLYLGEREHDKLWRFRLGDWEFIVPCGGRALLIDRVADALSTR